MKEIGGIKLAADKSCAIKGFADKKILINESKLIIVVFFQLIN